MSLFYDFFLSVSIFLEYHHFEIFITSIAARGGGGSFKTEKIYNSEEQVPIEFVRVTCFNNSHFEELFFNMCGSQDHKK